MVFQSKTDYNKEVYPPSILARGEGLRSPQHTEIDFSIYGDVVVFPPGLFAGTTAVANIYRFLPRTKWKSVDGNVGTVSRWTAGLFVPGDIITIIDTADGSAGAAVGTVASVDVTGDVNKITFTAAPTAPAADTVIGIATSRPVTSDGNRLGLISPNQIIYTKEAPNSDFGVFLGGVVHRSIIPHIDPELESLYPQLDFVTP